jgi:hypothetical protein
MVKSLRSSNKIEIISEGTLDRPALVRVGQQEYSAFPHDPNTILILEDVARELLLRDLPRGIALTPCKRLQFLGELDSEAGEDLEIPISPWQFEGIAPFRIYHLGNGRAGIVFSWYCTKGFWDNESGYRWKLTRARAAVLARRKGLSGIRFHRFVDHGYLAGVEFSMTFPSGSVETVMESAFEISETLHSVIEDSVKIKIEQDRNEAGFVRDRLIPLLRDLGFHDVMFHHGPREFGRDVLFSRQTEFGIPEYWAAQVKLGNVGGKANSFVDLIVSQAEEAFKMPLYNIHTKSKVWISKFLVVITGKFTDNAVEKICEKIESYSLKNNIIFLDGERLDELARNARVQRRPQSRKNLHQLKRH